MKQSAPYFKVKVLEDPGVESVHAVKEAVGYRFVGNRITEQILTYL
jgi:hypothetical protein